MVTGNWNNNDGLYLKYGTSKAVPATAGDFLGLGSNRIIEFKIADMSTLTTSSVIQEDNLFLPTNCIIEFVEVIADTVCTSSGSGTLSVGLYKDDRTTAISETAILSAFPFASIDAQGEKTIVPVAGTGAGTKIGTTIGSDRGYLSAKVSAAYQTGAVTIRIHYRGTGTITQ